MLQLRLIYCKIRRKIKYFINQILIFLYKYILVVIFWPWFRAYFISIWNKYLEHPIYQYRIKDLGRQFAKEMFFDDPIVLYEDYKKRVLKDKRLLIQILINPYSIQPKDNFCNRIITANDLWR